MKKIDDVHIGPIQALIGYELIEKVVTGQQENIKGKWGKIISFYIEQNEIDGDILENLADYAIVQNLKWYIKPHDDDQTLTINFHS